MNPFTAASLLSIGGDQMMDLIERLEKFRRYNGYSKAHMARLFTVPLLSYKNWGYRGIIPEGKIARAEELLASSEALSAVKTAAELVNRYSDTQCCLDREFRDALKVVASAALNQSESQQIASLKDIIHHAWIHGAYEDLGRDKMSSQQRAFYDSLKAEFSAEN